MKQKSFALCAILFSLTLSMFIVQGLAAQTYSGSVDIEIRSNTKTYSTSLGAGAMAVQSNTTIIPNSSTKETNNTYDAGHNLSMLYTYYQETGSSSTYSIVPTTTTYNNFYLIFHTPDYFIYTMNEFCVVSNVFLNAPNKTSTYNAIYDDITNQSTLNWSKTLSFAPSGMNNVTYQNGTYLVNGAVETGKLSFGYCTNRTGIMMSQPNSHGNLTYSNKIMNLYYDNARKLMVKYATLDDALAANPNFLSTTYIEVRGPTGNIIGYNPRGMIEFSKVVIQKLTTVSANLSTQLNMSIAGQINTGITGPMSSSSSLNGFHILGIFLYNSLVVPNSGLVGSLNMDNTQMIDPQGLITSNPITREGCVNFSIDLVNLNRLDLYLGLIGPSYHGFYVGRRGYESIERFTNTMSVKNFGNSSNSQFQNFHGVYSVTIDTNRIIITRPTSTTADFAFNDTLAYLSPSVINTFAITGTYYFVHTLVLTSVNTLSQIDGITFLKCSNTYIQPSGWSINASILNSTSNDYFENVSYITQGSNVERKFIGYSYDFAKIEEPEEPEDPEDPEDPEKTEEPKEPETPTLPTIGSLFDGLMDISPFTKMLVLVGIIWYFCFFKQGKSITEIWNPKKK